MNLSYESLNLKPGGEFFKMIDFYSSLKNNIITAKEYDDVKKLFTILKNFQGAIILCKIFESRASLMNKKYKFKPRRCHSASTLSSCIQESQSKVIILLPTKAETVELFGKMFIGGFSSVDTRLAFGKTVLMPNLENNDETIKRKDMKVGYKSRNTKTNRYESARILETT